MQITLGRYAINIKDLIPALNLMGFQNEAKLLYNEYLSIISEIKSSKK